MNQAILSPVLEFELPYICTLATKTLLTLNYIGLDSTDFFLWRDATACCWFLLSGESISKMLQAHGGGVKEPLLRAGDPGLK